MTRSHKRPYPQRYTSKRFDPSCRNHGGCPWCERGRLHSTLRRMPPAIMTCGHCGESEEHCQCPQCMWCLAPEGCDCVWWWAQANPNV